MKEIDEFVARAGEEVTERIARKREYLRAVEEQIERIQAADPDAPVADLIHQTADISAQIQDMQRETYLLSVAYELREADRYRSGRRKPAVEDAG